MNLAHGNGTAHGKRMKKGALMNLNHGNLDESGSRKWNSSRKKNEEWGFNELESRKLE